MLVPVALAEMNGSLRTGQKSVLVDVITSGINCPSEIELLGNSCLLIDGLALVSAIHRKKKDGGSTFYHNTLRTKLSPRRHMERYGLMAVIPTLTALLLSSLNDLQFFFVFLYALLEFSCAKHYR